MHKGKPFHGRKCAVKENANCKQAHNDLHNLVPAIGEINGDRSNFPFAEIPGELRKYGKCDFEIENSRAEPRIQVRGDIARIYFFMNFAYPELSILTKEDETFFSKWDAIDPVSSKECDRDNEIFNIQDTHNPFVLAHCPSR
jgi:deoxyribonuclease-1